MSKSRDKRLAEFPRYDGKAIGSLLAFAPDFALAIFRLVGSALRHRVVEIAPGDDVVPIEDRPRPVA
jgi:hypothetical protein